MFQPFITEIVHMRGSVFENLTDKYTKLAAREGYLSNNLRTQLLNEVNQLHFNTSEVIITSNTLPVERGQTISLTIEYPIGNIFVLMNWFSADQDMGNYKFTASEMSEYIP